MYHKAVKILSCFVIAMVISVVVAWVDSLRNDSYTTIHRNNRSGQNGLIWEYTLLGKGIDVSVLRQAINTEHSAIRGQVDSGPWWSQVRSAPDVDNVNSYTLHLEEARGWPLPCVISRYTSQPTFTSWTVLSGIPTGLQPHDLHNLPHVLPIEPIWIGLFVNGAVYFVIPWAVFAAYSRLRKSRRRKQGRCINCGYPRSDSLVCSECGHSEAGFSVVAQ